MYLVGYYLGEKECISTIGGSRAFDKFLLFHTQKGDDNPPFNLPGGSPNWTKLLRRCFSFPNPLILVFRNNTLSRLCRWRLYHVDSSRREGNSERKRETLKSFLFSLSCSSIKDCVLHLMLLGFHRNAFGQIRELIESGFRFQLEYKCRLFDSGHGHILMNITKKTKTGRLIRVSIVFFEDYTLKTSVNN